ncbi:hypothetical protein QQS21_003597 [Conoideocrella luteorostrata]|uniref:Probable dipeptidyl-aminopeptidase B n=1 Tax=Conoideocrella luteorostrata TaxID=1105319 RepID=A0AAJ0CT25_9HYPO|nr:hypothetical protein QQS21_003597 [Conoideocrella luteorostrata]
MDELEKRVITEATVTPHWLPGGNSFWYLHRETAEKWNFVLVDASKRTRGPAFDQMQLATALQRQTGDAVDHEALPFTWIDIQADKSVFFFRFAGRKWQYGLDNVLKEVQMYDGERDPRLLEREAPSPEGVIKVSVTFVNHSKAPLKTYWINYDGEAQFYSRVAVGATRDQDTYAGHVWRLVDEVSGKTMAIYSVPDQGQDVLVIKDERDTGEDMQGEVKDQTRKNFEDTGDDEENHVTSSKATTIMNPKTADTGKPKPPAFIEDDKLWVKEPDGRKIQIISTKNKFDCTNLFLSPDESFAVAWEYTPAEDHVVNMVESAPADQLQPKLKSIQYLKPGDRVRVDRPRLFDLDKRIEIHTDSSLFTNPYSLYNIGWNKLGSEYRFIFNERGHQRLKVLSIHVDGFVRVVLSETSETFIDYSSKMDWEIDNDSEEMIWASERDGYNHLYLIDLAKGTVKNQITRGQWNVTSVDHIDKARRMIWLKSYGILKEQDPYYAHLVRVNFDGSDLRILTDGDGTHTWQWSPDRRYFVDTWSRVDFPPQVVLRDAESGGKIMFLEGSTLINLQRAHWNAPERFVAPGRDGDTLIFGIILRPPTFDESKVYPILEDIYAGPQDFFTPKAFTPLGKTRRWAKQGFVVVKLDGMGTNWRSKKFQNVCYKNLKDAGLPDRIAWIKAAAATRPWMDLSRVGIFGVSAGGQSAAAAMLHQKLLQGRGRRLRLPR